MANLLNRFKREEMSISTKEIKKRGERTTFFQLRAMVDWLEEFSGDNFRLITGDGAENYTAVVAGNKLTKVSSNHIKVGKSMSAIF